MNDNFDRIIRRREESKCCLTSCCCFGPTGPTEPTRATGQCECRCNSTDKLIVTGGMENIADEKTSNWIFTNPMELLQLLARKEFIQVLGL